MLDKHIFPEQLLSTRHISSSSEAHTVSRLIEEKEAEKRQWLNRLLRGVRVTLRGLSHSNSGAQRMAGGSSGLLSLEVTILVGDV